MLFKKDQKIAIQAGHQTLTFRRWASPKAKKGGQYNIPPYGAIEVTQIELTRLSNVSERDAVAAGFKDLATLKKQLNEEDKDLYRIAFKYLGTDPVKVPDRTNPDKVTTDAILKRLERMAWATKAIDLIAENEGTRAGDLAPRLGQDTPTFKRNIRKLKQLGLTISLETGYKLSPRGKSIRKRLSK